MKYYFSRTVSGNFNDIIEEVTGLLKEIGFGVLTSIDVKETLKKKIDVDFKSYTILGACNPQFAYKAIKAEDKIGTLLPYNVIVIDQGNNNIEVAAMDPVAMMSQMGNPQLEEIAGQVNELLKSAIEKIGVK
ncbi:MAG: DUF302 domain-containing protein [Candidatus Aegiribacteria sp.]|nr:DUF302 domain-containing protein [Candidatus Aegiribacteria sp.]